MALLGLALTACSTNPFYTFNIEPTGNIKGWAAVGIRDDQGVVHQGPGGAAMVTLFFADQHEAPAHFPCTASTPASCDKITGYGSLGIGMPQGSVLKATGFPDGSAYWEVDVLSPVLPMAAQGLTGLGAQVGDMYGVDAGHVSASLFLVVKIGAATQQVLPTGGPKFTTVAKTAWTSVLQPFTLPAGAVPYQIGIRLRGDWKGHQAYDGALFIDNVGVLK